MRRLLTALVVLAVLAVATDRIALLAVERVAATELQRSQDLDGKPDVTIAGIPFLTQFAAGRYDHVTATARQVPVGDTPLRISRVRVDFRGVTAARDFQRFSARTGTARATLTYADLSRALDARVRYAGDGRIEASKRFTVLGQRVRPTVSVRPSVANQVLGFTGSQLEGLQDAPPSVQRALRDVFDTRFRLDDLPFDVQVRRLEVDREGVQLRLTGRDLRYTVSR